jgi:transketolase
LALSPIASEQTAGLRPALAETMDAVERSQRLKEQSTDIRRSVIEMIGRARLGHIGGDFSVADIPDNAVLRRADTRPHRACGPLARPFYSQ